MDGNELPSPMASFPLISLAKLLASGFDASSPPLIPLVLLSLAELLSRLASLLPRHSKCCVSNLAEVVWKQHCVPFCSSMESCEPLCSCWVCSYDAKNPTPPNVCSLTLLCRRGLPAAFSPGFRSPIQGFSPTLDVALLLRVVKGWMVQRVLLLRCLP